MTSKGSIRISSSVNFGLLELRLDSLDIWKPGYTIPGILWGLILGGKFTCTHTHMVHGWYTDWYILLIGKSMWDARCTEERFDISR